MQHPKNFGLIASFLERKVSAHPWLPVLGTKPACHPFSGPVSWLSGVHALLYLSGQLHLFFCLRLLPQGESQAGPTRDGEEPQASGPDRPGKLWGLASHSHLPSTLGWAPVRRVSPRSN